MNNEKIVIEEIRKETAKRKKITDEVASLSKSLNNTSNIKERRIISSQIKKLNDTLEETNSKLSNYTKELSAFIYVKKNPLGEFPSEEIRHPKKNLKFSYTDLEKSTLKRLSKKREIISEKKEKKPSSYVNLSNKIFYGLSSSLIKNGAFNELKKNVVRSNLEFIPATYLSIVFFTTLLSGIVSLFLLIFFMFFSVSLSSPFIISISENSLIRVLRIVGILILLPLATFLFSYFYPSMERKSFGNRINYELPLATMHMSSVSSSMIEPSKIFSIITSTKEYPFLEKEFIKIQNEINIYGYDLVTALKNRARNSPSTKLAELLNGMAITITSGGDLPEFLEKRSQNLLFEHRLDIEKQSKAAETFMDIYISVVIAAPMILMLLLMIMSISGFGISLNPSIITLIIVFSVSLINVFFLVFLHLKQPKN